MKNILLLLNSDRYSLPLIRYLILEGRRYGWKTYIGSMFDESISDRIRKKNLSSDLGFIHIADFHQCNHALRKSDLIIAMVNEPILPWIVDRCIFHGKSLITPCKLNQEIYNKNLMAEDRGSLMLFEAGFSPGLDHITTMKAIDNIYSKGGDVLELRTYSGSMAADHCVNNPWKLKLTEPASELIGFGKYNNRHFVHGEVKQIPYFHLFDRSESIKIHGMDGTIAIPDGDSLYYRRLYGLNKAHTVVRSKIFHESFQSIWKLLVQLGITDNVSVINLNNYNSFYCFLDSLLPHLPKSSIEYKLMEYANARPEDIEKLKWLGLFDNNWFSNYKKLAPADILRVLLENKLSLNYNDEDYVVMKHQLVYKYKGLLYDLKATFKGKGENKWDSAIAKARGLAAGAAAKAFLLGDIQIKGIHVPVLKEIYEPMLQELEELGVVFKMEEEVKYVPDNELVNGVHV